MQGFDVFGGFDVGEQLNVDAVGRGGGGFFDFVEFALVAAVFAGEAAVFVEDDFVGIDDEGAVDAVDDDDFVFGNEFAGVVQADDGRDVEAAAQDGGVAGRATGIGYEGGNVLLFEQYGIGRREVVRDEDGVVKQVAGEVDFVALADKVVVDAADNLEHVLFAFAQVVVVDAVELGGKLVALLFQCPFGVDFLLAQNVDGFAREGNVGQQHQVQGDERAQFGRGVFGNRAAQLFQFFARGFDGVVETGSFGIEFVGIDVVLGDFRCAARDEVGVADGNAFARGYTV